jgi:hypothetical protein
MREHELDDILLRERNVVPSTKFTKSVMDAVRFEAATLPPIPFPWLRALPGLAAGIFASMWIVIEGFQLYEPPQRATALLPASWIERLTRVIAGTESSGAGWILLALAVTAVCVELTWRVSERRG